MKNSIIFLKKGLAILLVVLLVSRPVESAHAVITEATIGLAISIVALAQSYGESASVQERQEIKDLVHDCFSLKANVSGTTITDGEHLHEMYLELCNLGFPCEVKEVYIENSWYYCIVGTGYVDLPDSYFDLFPDDIPIHDRVYTNSNGLAYAANYKPTSNNYLQWIWEDVGSALQSVNAHLGAIEDRLLRFYDFITGYRDNAGNMPGTNLYDKMNEMINAINGISVSGGSLDVTPITDKLTEVVGRFNALIDEVFKISTFADLHEVITVTPGVLGDVDVVTSGGWQYEDLAFYYDPDPVFVRDGSSRWYCDSDMIPLTGTDEGTVDHIVWDFNTWGGTDVEIQLTQDFLKFADDAPEFTLEFIESGGYTVFTVSSQDLLSGSRYYSVYSPAEIFCIRISFGHSAGWFKSTLKGKDILFLKYGTFEYPASESLSFTADGVPHTLYWSNEYEFADGYIYPWQSVQYQDGHWFLDGTWPLAYYDAYLTDALTSAPTTTTTIEGETYTWFEWFYTSFKGGGGSLDVTPIVNKLKDIENALANMGSEIDIENNTNINISEENENYNIFYVDDPDGGEDKSIVDLSGDTLKVFGKLLDFLYKVSFKGALDNAGSGIGDLSDFYFDTSEGSADLWAS